MESMLSQLLESIHFINVPPPLWDLTLKYFDSETYEVIVLQSLHCKRVTRKVFITNEIE